MPAKSIEPLKKVTVELFLDDVEFIKRLGVNFTEFVREAVRERVQWNKRCDAKPEPFTIGDLEHD